MTIMSLSLALILQLPSERSADKLPGKGAINQTSKITQQSWKGFNMPVTDFQKSDKSNLSTQDQVIPDRLSMYKTRNELIDRAEDLDKSLRMTMVGIVENNNLSVRHSGPKRQYETTLEMLQRNGASINAANAATRNLKKASILKKQLKYTIDKIQQINDLLGLEHSDFTHFTPRDHSAPTDR